MSNELTNRTDFVDLKSLKDVTGFAKELKAYVVEQGLFTPIQNKNYVNVEGWEFAGAGFGIFPIPKNIRNLSTDDEIKYEVEVELIKVSDGTKVGAGFAVCSNREKGRDKNDEYVILSMAQTRATGKAFRLCIGWVMKLAGYEGTPTEEVEAVPGYTAQEKTLTRSISTIRRELGKKGYTTKESQHAFMKQVLRDADELIEAIDAEPTFDELELLRQQ